MDKRAFLTASILESRSAGPDRTPDWVDLQGEEESSFKDDETLARILHVTGNDRLGTTAIYLKRIILESTRNPGLNLFAGICKNPVVGSVVGGIVSISGAFIGALFIEFMPNFVDQISKAAPDAIFGIFLIGLIYLMPRGAIGILEFIRVHLRRVAVSKRQKVDRIAG
jgi:hypothetical protein